MRTTRKIAVLATLVAAAVGCSGGGGSSSDSSATTASSVARATTIPATTVAETSTTALAAPVPVYPLTGLPVTDEAAAQRPAMVVKIDNHGSARPQSGLNEADIVFEEIVESGTRFAVVFHSQGSDPVGPIRSGRTQDVDLLGSLNKPLFVWSGGNNGVTGVIRKSDLVDLSAQHNEVFAGGGFFRNAARNAPHNLYAKTSMLWTLAPTDAGPPPQQFTYVPTGATATGDSSSGVDLNMDGSKVGWRYDAASAMYLRTAAGEPHADAESGQVASSNVIVMIVKYRPSPADSNSPEAQTIGSGEVLVFTAGRVTRGTWTRGDRLSPVVLTDAGGAVIALTPGRTWIELAKADSYTIAA